ncbi:MAG: hypothetical protein LUG85_02295 [Clostridiales bacterium]|nr:hypothetical protein [Clostridiales bacterium]
MFYSKRSKRIIAAAVCLCLTALFAFWAAAGLHSLCCINESCAVCAAVHSFGYSGKGLGGGALPAISSAASFLFVLLLWNILNKAADIGIFTPVRLKIRLDI